LFPPSRTYRRLAAVAYNKCNGPPFERTIAECNGPPPSGGRLLDAMGRFFSGGRLLDAMGRRLPAGDCYS